MDKSPFSVLPLRPAGATAGGPAPLGVSMAPRSMARCYRADEAPVKGNADTGGPPAARRGSAPRGRTKGVTAPARRQRAASRTAFQQGTLGAVKKGASSDAGRGGGGEVGEDGGRGGGDPGQAPAGVSRLQARASFVGAGGRSRLVVAAFARWEIRAMTDRRHHPWTHPSASALIDLSFPTRGHPTRDHQQLVGAVGGLTR